ncbi:hypothetical protein L4D77_22210 [Photobacterium frigidiphilum]|uniref:hypothetical protein n=1 Tax=Photobacterium frigidiphilum TaxID=264736 RepID=UPI003D0C3575
MELIIFVNILISYLGLYDITSIALYVLIPINFMAVLMFFEMKAQEMMFFVVLSAVLTFFFIYAQNTEYIILISLGLICTRVEYGRLIKYLWFYVSILLFIFILLRYPEHALYTRGDGTVRYDLGFNNPNILAKYAFSVIILTLAFQKKFLALILTLVFYSLSGSRTLLYCLLLYPILMLYLQKMPVNKLIFKLPIVCAFPILTILSVLLAEYSKEYVFIDVLLSFRPMHWINYLEAYPISNFGYTWEALDYFVLDNSFLQILVRLGLSGIIVFSLFYYWLLNSLLKLGNVKLLFCVIATLIYSVFENMLKYPLFNISTVLSLVYINSVLFERNKNVSNQA